jgi:hypothetical protein
VAIRHGDEHVHLVITLARQDAGRADLWNDHFKLRGYCRAQEKALGLVATGPADRTAARAPTNPNSRPSEIDPSHSYSNLRVRPPHQGTLVTGRSACRRTGL